MKTEDETSRDEDDSFSNKMKNLTPKFGTANQQTNKLGRADNRNLASSGAERHSSKSPKVIHFMVFQCSNAYNCSLKMRKSISFNNQGMSEAAMAAQKAVMKRETEFELKKLQNALDAERKEKEAQYR